MGLPDLQGPLVLLAQLGLLDLLDLPELQGQPVLRGLLELQDQSVPRERRDHQEDPLALLAPLERRVPWELPGLPELLELLEERAEQVVLAAQQMQTHLIVQSPLMSSLAPQSIL